MTDTRINYRIKLVLELVLAGLIGTSAAKELGYHDLKPEQLAVVETVMKGYDVFAVLPTGHGKSLCFAYLPLCLTNCWVWVENTVPSRLL